MIPLLSEVAVQQAEAVRQQIDLNTVLLTIVLAISGWTLTTVLRHMRTLTQIEQQLWGKDGKNGHASDLRELKRAMKGLSRVITRLVRRVDRLEQHNRLPALPHDADTDDAEED